ncbi:hypothetical protein QOT17_013608 [Balamuthia mandrillaris]
MKSATLVLAILLQSLLLVRGQTCEPWSGTPAYCAQFEEWQGSDVHIYVPVNASLRGLQDSVAFAINLVGALGDDGSLASRCNRMWVRLNCATHLRPCGRIPVEGGVLHLEVPVQPCLSSCLEYINLCTEYVESQGLPVGGSLYFPPGFEAPLTCLENDTNGEPLYQTTNYSVYTPAFDDPTFRLQCNELPPNGTFLVCEPPLTSVEGTNNCAFVCPLPAYSEDQYDSIKSFQLVVGWLSWGGSMIVILSYSLHNKLRKFPSNLILMAAVAAHAESVGMILPTFFGYHNTWCGFDTTYLMPESDLANQQLTLYFDIDHLSVHSGLCTFQGWLVQMGFLSSTMWWGIVAFNMFLSVYFSKKLPTTKSWNVGLQVTYHVCGWAVPAILMLIPAAADEIDYAPGGTLYDLLTTTSLLPPRYHFEERLTIIHSCSLGSANEFFLTFWAIPIGIILLVGTLLFVASLVRLLKFARQLKELKKTCGTYFRVILFILIYLVLITFIFAYSLRVVTAKDTIEDGYSEYYQCLLAVRQDDCTLSESVHNFDLAMLRSFGYSSLGLLLFFNFCISPSMGRFWWRFFDKLRQGRFTSIFTSEKTPNTGKSPGKTKKSTGTHDMITMSVAEEEGGNEVIP